MGVARHAMIIYSKYIAITAMLHISYIDDNMFYFYTRETASCDYYYVNPVSTYTILTGKHNLKCNWSTPLIMSEFVP